MGLLFFPASWQPPSSLLTFLCFPNAAQSVSHIFPASDHFFLPIVHATINSQLSYAGSFPKRLSKSIPHRAKRGIRKVQTYSGACLFKNCPVAFHCCEHEQNPSQGRRGSMLRPWLPPDSPSALSSGHILGPINVSLWASGRAVPLLCSLAAYFLS